MGTGTEARGPDKQRSSTYADNEDPLLHLHLHFNSNFNFNTRSTNTNNMPLPSNVHVSSHPCLQAKLSQLRSQSTRPRETRALVHEIASILGVEAFASGLKLKPTGKVAKHLHQARLKTKSNHRTKPPWAWNTKHKASTTPTWHWSRFFALAWGWSRVRL